MERVLLVFLTWYTLTSNIGLKGLGFFSLLFFLDWITLEIMGALQLKLTQHGVMPYCFNFDINKIGDSS